MFTRSVESKVAFVALDTSIAFESPAVWILRVSQNACPLMYNVARITRYTVSILSVIVLTKRTHRRTLAYRIHIKLVRTFHTEVVAVELPTVWILEENLASILIGIQTITGIATCAGAVAHIGCLAQRVNSFTDSFL